MDFQAGRPPLLSPRPDFLGAGWGRERANTFLELLSISFISTFTSPSHIKDHDHALQLPTNHHKKSSSSAVEIAAVNKIPSQKDMAKKLKTKKTSICKTNELGTRGRPEDSAQTIGASSKLEKNDCLEQEANIRTNKYQFGPENYPYTQEALEVFKLFQKLKIPFETEIYRPKEERLDVDKNIFYCKNLFLKDRKGQFYLIIFHEDIEMNLKQLRKTLNAHRNFNFATANDMMDLLHVEPGGVTPLALMNSSARDIVMVISNSLMHDEAGLMFHPMDSNLATKISLQSLLRFLKHFGHAVTLID